jgi:hypothetical protein
VNGILRDERHKLGKSPIVDARIWNKAQAVLDARKPRHPERAAA